MAQLVAERADAASTAARRERATPRAGAAGATVVRPRRYLLLRVATVVGPLVFLALLDGVRHASFSAALHTLPGTALIGLVLLLAATLFSAAVFRSLERLQRTIVRQSARMAALEEHDRLAREINDDFLQ